MYIFTMNIITRKRSFVNLYCDKIDKYEISCRKQQDKTVKFHIFKIIVFPSTCFWYHSSKNGFYFGKKPKTIILFFSWELIGYWNVKILIFWASSSERIVGEIDLIWEVYVFRHLEKWGSKIEVTGAMNSGKVCWGVLANPAYFSLVFKLIRQQEQTV